MAERHRVHEPGCRGVYRGGETSAHMPARYGVPDSKNYCEGVYICRSCGKRTGWCRGDSSDLGCCPTCWSKAWKACFNRPAFKYTYDELEWSTVSRRLESLGDRTTDYGRELDPPIPERVKLATPEAAESYMLDRGLSW